MKWHLDLAQDGLGRIVHWCAVAAGLWITWCLQVVEVFLHDPLFKWALSQAKAQKRQLEDKHAGGQHLVQTCAGLRRNVRSLTCHSYSHSPTCHSDSHSLTCYSDSHPFKQLDACRHFRACMFLGTVLECRQAHDEELKQLSACFCYRGHVLPSFVHRDIC